MVGFVSFSSRSSSTPDMPCIMMSSTATWTGSARAMLMRLRAAAGDDHVVLVLEDDAQGLPRPLLVIDDEQRQLSRRGAAARRGSEMVSKREGEGLGFEAVTAIGGGALAMVRAGP